MGIDVRWEDEEGNPLGEPVFDPRNVLAHALERTTNADAKCVQFIDRYGDTLFNLLQVPTLVGELEELRLKTPDNEEQRHLADVLELLNRRQEPHAYVRFVGD